MSIVWFLLIGLCAGWLAGQIMKGGGYGMLGDIIIGVIGALL
ncbi:MAG: GlsB/YeaQ/YmgE family stress response membrane protein, partial [Thermoanaerobaculia bacterium]